LFASAGKIARTIADLKNTDALGLDGIPVSVLKKGVVVLASPIAHLINQSLALGGSLMASIHKSKGKSMSDPASYRPVSILPALSKVLEVIVQSDLQRHLATVDGLSNTQFGLRLGRSSKSAIATSHAHWLPGSRVTRPCPPQARGISKLPSKMQPGPSQGRRGQTTSRSLTSCIVLGCPVSTP
jgi:hypothetical protein